MTHDNNRRGERPNTAPFGFYLLNAEGQLGWRDPARGFVVDAALTASFADYNRKYLQTYLANVDIPGFRLGIAYRAAEKRKWDDTTLALETAPVQALYPVSGLRTSELTESQRKHREQNIYRGIELLLEHRNRQFPDTAIYAPILFDRGTTLDRYPALLDRPVRPADHYIDVIEVVNLLAGIPLPKRSSAPVHALLQTLHRGAVRKDARKTVSYDIGGRDERTAPVDALSAVDGLRAPTETPTSSNPWAYSAARRDDSIPTTPSSTPILLRAAPEIPSFDAGVTATRTLLTTRMLQGLTQFHHLSPSRLQWLAREATIYQAASGAQIIKRGSIDPGTFYLLEGRVEIEAADGAKQILEGRSPKASAPIAFLKPRKYDVVALTPVSFIWIDDLVLEMALSEQMRMPAVLAERV